MIPRIWALVTHDLRLLVRRGFFVAYAVLTVLYVAILLALPEGVRDHVLVVVLFSDPAVMGFFFVSATLLLERQDGTLEPLFISPTSPGEYLFARTTALTLLAVVTCALVALAASEVRWLRLVLAVALISPLFIAVGVAIASRFSTFNQVLGVSSAVATPLFGPMLFVLLDIHVPGLGLLPAGASLRLLQSAFLPGHSLDLVDVALVLAWNGAMWAWAAAWFRRYAAGRVGSEVPA